MSIFVRRNLCRVFPEADVVCYGLWVDPSLATHHGVFASDRKHPEQLDFMLPEAFVGRIGIFIEDPFVPDGHRYMALSDRAVEILIKNVLIKKALKN